MVVLFAVKKIVAIVFSSLITQNLCCSLKLLIKEHHSLFVKLYGKEKPKLHFLLYYPEQMMALGPMIRTWTIRHEAKLNFFRQHLVRQILRTLP